jgi:CubicO group peptidase (beta-lactamase class C family)
LCTVLSEFRNTPKADIRISHLLYHTSGIPNYRPYYQDIRRLPVERRKKALRKRLISEPLVFKTGTQTVYSDIGFMILEWVIEHLTGERLDRFVQDKIYDCCGINDLFYIDHEHIIPQRDYAATELCPWRQIILNGLVHDDNAYVAGGVAGHAGLFGTAESVHSILIELLKTIHGKSGKKIFSRDLLGQFLNKSNKHQRALGFDVPSPTGSSCGELFSKNFTVGHLGFTGTSFWMDIQQKIIIILLTNRIHPTRQNEQIKNFRPVIHNRIMKELKRIFSL